MERPPRLLVLLLLLVVVEAFVVLPLPRQQARPPTTRAPLPGVARHPLLLPLQLSPQRDPRPASAGLEDEEEDGLVGSSPVGVLVRSHAAVMRALCPPVSGCRIYLPSDLLLLDPPEDEDEDGRSRQGLGQRGVDWRLEDAALDVYLAACEPVAGSGNFLARPREGPLPAALLAPFGADGWIAVELAGAAPALPHSGSSSSSGGDEQWRALEPALACLRTALAVAGRERAAGQRAQGTFRRMIREIRQPVGALRTFGKLLLRRLEKTDAEGLNQELTSNVLVSSDALVEVLHRYEGREKDDDEEEDEEEEDEYAGTPPPVPEPSQLAPSGQGSGSGSGGASSARALCDPRTVLAPILAAAQAISARDGVQFQCYVEEGLPRILIDERGFQEALGTMIELALASSLAGAVAAAAGAADVDAAKPAVSLEVASRNGKGVEIVVRDNGLGDTSMRGGRELGRAREVIERMGARLQTRRSISLGGTHMSILVD